MFCVKNRNVFALYTIALVAFGLPNSLVKAEIDAKQLLNSAEVAGGLFVHLGAKSGHDTSSLQKSEMVYVQGLSRNPQIVADARDDIWKKGVYGRVSFDLLSGDSLPYVDNFVNLIVVEDAMGIAQEEISRVLAPNGVAMIQRDGRWEKNG